MVNVNIHLNLRTKHLLSSSNERIILYIILNGFDIFLAVLRSFLQTRNEINNFFVSRLKYIFYAALNMVAFI